MFDNLLDLVKEQAGEAIINNPVIPNEHNDAAIEVASTSIFDTLKNAVASGNLNSVIGMFSGGSANASSSTLAGVMQNDIVQNLINKFGINQAQATGIADGLLPNVLQNLIHKTNDPNDSNFNIQDIVSSLTGGSGGFDVGDLLNQFSNNSNIHSKTVVE